MLTLSAPWEKSGFIVASGQDRLRVRWPRCTLSLSVGLRTLGYLSSYAGQMGDADKRLHMKVGASWCLWIIRQLNWVYACALKHELPDLMQGLRGGTLPVAFFLPKPEALKARYPNPLPKAYPKSLNPQWEVCHIDDVAGRMFRGNILQTPIEDLKERMILLMSPANMFLVHGHAGRGNPLG